MTGETICWARGMLRAQTSLLTCTTSRSWRLFLTTRDVKTRYQSVLILWKLSNFKKSNPWTCRFLQALLDQRENTDKLLAYTSYRPECSELSLEDAIGGGREMAEKSFLNWESDVKRNVPVNRAGNGWGPPEKTTRGIKRRRLEE